MGQSSTAPVYLDANATTGALSVVVDAVASAMAGFQGNASSAHWLGGEARAALERARDDVVLLFNGALPEGVVFTSGGTEGNNTILGWGTLCADSTLITCAVEHPSVLRPADAFARAGGDLVVLPVSTDGLVDPEALAAAVGRARGRVVLSIQWANSETGVMQPMRDLVSAARLARPDVLVHSDAAQAVGRVWLDLEETGVDVATFSGHKLHGPHGTGAMVFHDPDERRIAPLALGGGQERGMRSGTQNVAGAVGLGLAMRVRAEGFAAATSALAGMRDSFESLVLQGVPYARVNGAGAPRVPNTTSIRFPGSEAMEMAARLDAAGIACSVGSACSASKPAPSHVLTAMGLPEREAFSSLRFSFSVLNTPEEAERAARLVVDTYRGTA
jgi:cysteine desulfurase